MVHLKEQSISSIRWEKAAEVEKEGRKEKEAINRQDVRA